MKAKTEQLLYELLWMTELLSRPTLGKWSESFEGWAHRRGFLRQLHELERQAFLERQEQPAGQVVSRIYRLTEKGLLQATGGRDPVKRWNRPWDGRWRLVVFDIPEKQRSARLRLRRFLRDQGFGCLQNSVWVTPDPLDELTQELSGFGDDVESLISFNAQTAAGEPTKAVVQGAWDFQKINRLYEDYLKVLGQIPKREGNDESAAAKRLQRWTQQEREAWLEAVAADPLLPDELLPDGYQGKQAWHKRSEALAGVRTVQIK